MLEPLCRGRKHDFTNGRSFFSGMKIRALLGTSEFFLINATNADFIA